MEGSPPLRLLLQKNACLKRQAWHIQSSYLLTALAAPQSLHSGYAGRAAVAKWWERPNGGWVCGVCHPNPSDKLLRLALDGVVESTARDGPAMTPLEMLA
jgi:hypothetical protein